MTRLWGRHSEHTQASFLAVLYWRDCTCLLLKSIRPRVSDSFREPQDLSEVVTQQPRIQSASNSEPYSMKSRAIARQAFGRNLSVHPQSIPPNFYQNRKAQALRPLPQVGQTKTTALTTSKPGTHARIARAHAETGTTPGNCKGGEACRTAATDCTVKG